ncbi:UPF0158 family protein [Oceanisphaera arctica]|uniref:Uncharacterized protein n=1 Tax=Oceanisphaera arctica TaxID=641510 RepID=A0A2P5TQQ5_9GAMM|nr:UPF0158 family protein [Oceanisphaera arctica]PPL18088.1 hypothetical protein UN63_02715 [Oceanisphaera arctica]GHA09733.1 hypothetical protein GCM10007082_08420 [Oceanisphaera arctica]
MKFTDILDAFEMIGGAPMGEADTYICKETGQVYIDSTYCDEPMPDDLGSDRYLCLPDKRDLDLGRRLAERFAWNYLPGDAEKVEDIFRSRGAYGRFKSLLERRNMLDQWYQYEAQATETALREWCELNDIELDNG